MLNVNNIKKHRGSVTGVAPTLVGAGRSVRPSGPGTEPEHQRMHLRPVWIVLILLLPCLALTFYYSQVVVPGGEELDSLLPTTSYAFVLLLLNLDLIGFVVLMLLLSRNLIKAYFERRHRLLASGFPTKLVPALLAFSFTQPSSLAW